MESIYQRSKALLDESVPNVRKMTVFRWIVYFFCAGLLLLSIAANALIGTDSGRFSWWIFDFSPEQMVVVVAVLSQLRLFLAAFLTIEFYKMGFYLALVLQTASFLGVFFKEDSGNDYFPLALMFTFTSILLTVIIHIYNMRVLSEVEKAGAARSEALSLYEELAAADEELSQQNQELYAYNERLLSNEKELHFIAYYDVLTGLPNRKMVENELDMLITRNAVLPENERVPFGVAFIDLDNFKMINDTTGHHTGDLFLMQVTARLSAVVHAEDLLGRIGGDEFALIMKRELSAEDALAYAEKIRNSLHDAFSVEGIVFHITASIGVAFYPCDGGSAEEMLRCADTAMYKAKEKGKNSVIQFCCEMKQELVDKIDFEKNLLAALDNNEINIAFQPQYVGENHQLRGFEALARWNSAAFGAVPPSKFIPVSEETKFILRLGEWILEQACERFRCTCSKFSCQFILSVNISAVQIMDSNFIPMVDRVLKKTGFNPGCLELEITETVLITSPRHTAETLKDLKNRGIRIALDDFGTGYSSLSYLQHLPIDTLKIDKAFVDNINGKEDEKIIIGSIIDLVHKLDMDVVAEGVETENQLEYLNNQKCDCIQGFIFGRPVSAEEMERIIERQLSCKQNL